MCKHYLTVVRSAKVTSQKEKCPFESVLSQRPCFSYVINMEMLLNSTCVFAGHKSSKLPRY